MFYLKKTGANASLSCTPQVYFPNGVICSYSILSNLGNYTLFTTFSDGQNLTETISDGTTDIGHTYALYGNYIVNVTVTFLSYSLSQSIYVNPGIDLLIVIYLFEIMF